MRKGIEFKINKLKGQGIERKGKSKWKGEDGTLTRYAISKDITRN